MSKAKTASRAAPVLLKDFERELSAKHIRSVDAMRESLSRVLKRADEEKKVAIGRIRQQAKSKLLTRHQAKEQERKISEENALLRQTVFEDVVRVLHPELKAPRGTESKDSLRRMEARSLEKLEAHFKQVEQLVKFAKAFGKGVLPEQSRFAYRIPVYRRMAIDAKIMAAQRKRLEEEKKSVRELFEQARQRKALADASESKSKEIRASISANRKQLERLRKQRAAGKIKQREYSAQKKKLDSELKVLYRIRECNELVHNLQLGSPSEKLEAITRLGKMGSRAAAQFDLLADIFSDSSQPAQFRLASAAALKRIEPADARGLFDRTFDAEANSEVKAAILRHLGDFLEIPQNVFRRLWNGLNEEQERMIRAVVSGEGKALRATRHKRLSASELRAYIVYYLHGEVQVAKTENEFLSHITRGIGNHGVTDANWHASGYSTYSPRGSCLTSLISLHAMIDEALFPKIDIGDGHIDTSKVEIVRNAQVIRNHDAFPGRKFKLGEEGTYYRELFRLRRAWGLTTFEFLKEAKRIANNLSGRHYSAREIAVQVSRKFNEMHPARESRVGEVRRREAYMTSILSDESEQGELLVVCRHRAASVALALQEAGVKARYVQGNLFGMPHAWVEVDVLGDGSYSFVVDPMQAVSGEITKSLDADGKTHYTLKRGESILSYEMDERAFNVIWRGKMVEGKKRR